MTDQAGHITINVDMVRTKVSSYAQHTVEFSLQHLVVRHCARSALRHSAFRHRAPAEHDPQPLCRELGHVTLLGLALRKCACAQPSVQCCERFSKMSER